MKQGQHDPNNQFPRYTDFPTSRTHSKEKVPLLKTNGKPRNNNIMLYIVARAGTTLYSIILTLMLSVCAEILVVFNLVILCSIAKLNVPPIFLHTLMV